MFNPDQTITTADVAKLLGVPARTITRWVKSGRLEAAHKLPGLRGAYLFDRSEVERLTERQSA